MDLTGKVVRVKVVRENRYVEVKIVRDCGTWLKTKTGMIPRSHVQVARPLFTGVVWEPISEVENGKP